MASKRGSERERFPHRQWDSNPICSISYSDAFAEHEVDDQEKCTLSKFVRRDHAAQILW